MTRDRIITALAAAAVASGLLVALTADDLGTRPADSRRHRKGESKLVELDGGKAYAYPTDVDCDGGIDGWRFDDGGVADVGLLMAGSTQCGTWTRNDGGSDRICPAWKTATCTEYVITTQAPCVRRPAGAPVASCMRREPDGGARDFGDLNRFPADEAVGAGCQGCACSIVLGEDSLEDEDVRLTREKARRK